MTVTHNPQADADQVRAAYGKTTDQLGNLGLTDMVELQAAFWRKQFGVLAAQADEVRALSTKVTAAAAEPIKSQMDRVVDGRAH